MKAGNRVIDIKKGDHVVVDPVISCGHCYPCKIGRPNVCSNLQVLGVHTDGGFSEYVVIPRKNIHKILKRLSWNEAAMIEPFTIAAQVTNRAEITAEDTSFIMGAGPIGQCILQAVKRVGAKCFISDILEQRLVKAKDMGADFTINANTEDVREVVMRATSNVGIPVVIDKVILQFN